MQENRAKCILRKCVKAIFNRDNNSANLTPNPSITQEYKRKLETKLDCLTNPDNNKNYKSNAAGKV